MNEAAAVTNAVTSIAFSVLGSGLALLGVSLAVALLIVLLSYFRRRDWRRLFGLIRSPKNPVLEAVPQHSWEAEAVFNPAAIVHDGRVHLLYRAVGSDGLSRIGYASSADGVYFDVRLPYPVFEARMAPTKQLSAARARPKVFSPSLYTSGGGWGGSEDPRAVVIDDELYLLFVAFQSWENARLTLTSIPLEEFKKQEWNWSPAAPISPPGEVHKNWVLFPEKIAGRYAILHSISPTVQIEYVDSLEHFDGTRFIRSNYARHRRAKGWDTYVRGAGPPPIKTSAGWLLLYHAIDEREPYRYKLGAFILDGNDPSRILYRTREPILSPDEGYENHGKPGVVYSCGAVVFGSDLFVYYGGADRVIAVAKANLNDFLRRVTHNDHAELSPS